MKTIADINAVRDSVRAVSEARAAGTGGGIRIAVGMATCGLAAGAGPVYDALCAEVKARRLENVSVIRTGCMGMCRLEPIVDVYVPGQERVTYVFVNADKAKKIVERHVVGGEIVEEYLADDDKEEL